MACCTSCRRRGCETNCDPRQLPRRGCDVCARSQLHVFWHRHSSANGRPSGRGFTVHWPDRSASGRNSRCFSPPARRRSASPLVGRRRDARSLLLSDAAASAARLRPRPRTPAASWSLRSSSSLVCSFSFTPYLARLYSRYITEEVVRVFVLALLPAEVPRQHRREAVGQVLERDLVLVVRIDVRRARVLLVQHRIQSISARVPLLEQLHRHLCRNIGVCRSDDATTGKKARARDVELVIAGAVAKRRPDRLCAVQPQVVVLDLAVVVLGVSCPLVIVVVDALHELGDRLFLMRGHAVDTHPDDGSLVDLAEIEAEGRGVAER